MHLQSMCESVPTRMVRRHCVTTQITSILRGDQTKHSRDMQSQIQVAQQAVYNQALFRTLQDREGGRTQIMTGSEPVQGAR